MSEYPSYQQNLSTSSTREEVILAIQNLSFAYALAPNSKVIEDFSCKVYAGQISLLLGPTGSGKSTILSLISPRLRLRVNKTVQLSFVDKRFLQ